MSRRTMAQTSRFVRTLAIVCGLLLMQWPGATYVNAVEAVAGDASPVFDAAGTSRTDAPSDRNDNGVGAEEDVEGLVLSKPDAANGVGEWVLETDDTETVTVVADSQTIFDQGIPAVGVWVDVDYVIQANGTWLASRIRPDDYEDGELVLRLMPGVDPEDIEDDYDIDIASTLLQSAGIFKFTIDDDVEPQLAETIAQDARVVWAEPNYVQSVPEEDGYATWGWGGTDPSGYANQGAFNQVNLAPALSMYSGKGVTVAVLDTGVALDHPMLKGRLVQGYDVVGDDANPSEAPSGLARGHGTHVIGIVAKVAPAADIMPVRVLDGNGRGDTFLIAYAIEWAVNAGADVINLSLGTDFDSKVLSDVIDAATQKGVVVVAAAGNQDVDQMRFPAGYDNVLAVTAVDHLNRKASFATYGDWVDLSAPGVGITSTVIGPQGLGYASWSGTSMAAPFVSGAAALALEKLPSATSRQVAGLLTSSGLAIDHANPAKYADHLGRLLAISEALVDNWHAEAYLPYLVR